MTRARAWCEALAVGTVFAFLALLMHAAYDYTEDQSFVETPALGWSGTVRALAVPGVRVHLYGKPSARPGRKMGHLSAVGATPEEALARVQQAYELLNP